MQYWQALGYAHPDELLEIAPVAEEVGFTGLLLSDHLFAPERFGDAYPYRGDGKADFDGASNFPEVWSTVAALSQRTQKLRFATNVYILPLRHPLDVAKQVGTAAVYSKNRVVLGVGVGWMREEFDALGVPFEERGPRTDEAIEVLKKLLTGNVVSHSGKYFSFPRLQMQPAPREPVPLWVGGSSPAALRRAARHADGWTGAGNTFEESEHILAQLAALRKEYGRSDRAFEAIVPLSETVEADQLARLRELGLTGSVNYPFPYTLGPEASLSQKLDALRHFGDRVIAKSG